MKELLDIYYKDFPEKVNWDSVIANDFQYIGNDLNQAEPLIGKHATSKSLNVFRKNLLQCW